MYLRFIKNTYFYVVKQNNRKYLHWNFSNEKIVTTKLHLSENFTFQKMLKKRKLLPAETIWKYFGF